MGRGLERRVRCAARSLQWGLPETKTWARGMTIVATPASWRRVGRRGASFGTRAARLWLRLPSSRCRQQARPNNPDYRRGLTARQTDKSDYCTWCPPAAADKSDYAQAAARAASDKSDYSQVASRSAADKSDLSRVASRSASDKSDYSFCLVVKRTNRITRLASWSNGVIRFLDMRSGVRLRAGDNRDDGISSCATAAACELVLRLALAQPAPHLCGHVARACGGSKAQGW